MLPSSNCSVSWLARWLLEFHLLQFPFIFLAVWAWFATCRSTSSQPAQIIPPARSKCSQQSVYCRNQRSISTIFRKHVNIIDCVCGKSQSSGDENNFHTNRLRDAAIDTWYHCLVRFNCLWPCDWMWLVPILLRLVAQWIRRPTPHQRKLRTRSRR